MAGAIRVQTIETAFAPGVPDAARARLERIAAAAYARATELLAGQRFPGGRVGQVALDIPCDPTRPDGELAEEAARQIAERVRLAAAGLLPGRAPSPVQPGEVVARWEESLSSCELVAGAPIELGSGRRFATKASAVAAAASWATAHDAHAAMVVRDALGYVPWSLRSTAWVSRFDRANVEDGFDRVTVRNPAVAAIVTSDGFEVPLGVTYVVRPGSEGPTWKATSVPGAGGFERLAAGDRSGVLELDDPQRVAVFLGALKGRALEALSRTEANVRRDWQEAAGNDGYLDKLRAAAAMDVQLARAIDELRGLGAHWRTRAAVARGEPTHLDLFRPDGPARLMGLPGSRPPRDPEAEALAHAEEVLVEAGLARLEQVRHSIRADFPVLNTLASGSVERGSNEGLRTRLDAFYGELLDNLQVARGKLRTGDIDPLDLGPLVTRTRADLEATDQHTTPFARAVSAHLRGKERRDTAFRWGAVGVGLGCLLAAPFTGGGSVALYLTLAGFGVGVGASLIEFEQSDDLMDVARASYGPGSELVDPFAAKLGYYFGVADLVLSALDVIGLGRAAKAGLRAAAQQAGTEAVEAGVRAARTEGPLQDWALALLEAKTPVFPHGMTSRAQVRTASEELAERIRREAQSQGLPVPSQADAIARAEQLLRHSDEALLTERLLLPAGTGDVAPMRVGRFGLHRDARRQAADAVAEAVRLNPGNGRGQYAWLHRRARELRAAGDERAARMIEDHLFDQLPDAEALVRAAARTGGADAARIGADMMTRITVQAAAGQTISAAEMATARATIESAYRRLAEVLPENVLERIRPSFEIHPEKSGSWWKPWSWKTHRAEHGLELDASGNMVGVVRIHPRQQLDITLHEIGHDVENLFMRSDGFAEVQGLLRRRAGDDPRHLRLMAFREGREWTRERAGWWRRTWDDTRARSPVLRGLERVGVMRPPRARTFVDPYAARYYNDDVLGSTEVISMGLENLCTPQRAREFFRRDPEHFAATLAALRDVHGDRLLIPDYVPVP